MRIVIVYRGNEDITPILEVAEKYGYRVVVRESDEYMALGPWGVSRDPNETTALIIRWGTK